MHNGQVEKLLLQRLGDGRKLLAQPHCFKGESNRERAMSMTILDPKIHLVKDTPASRFFRRKLNEPDVVTFWSSETGMWVLAFWVHRPTHVVEEIEDLGPAFEYLTPTFVKMIVSSYGPVDFGEKKKHILSRHRDRLRKQDDEVLADQDRWNWLRKRTKEEMALPYAFEASMSGGGVV